ncbi:hypothetical protein ACFS07_22025 [Undibacterium arcticum]
MYRATRQATALHPYALDGEARSALSAIVPAMLNGAMANTPQQSEAAITRVQGAIAGLPLLTQKEIQDLFALLAFGPARRLLAGVPDTWQHAKPDDVAAFLHSWRTHRIGMLQSAYFALHDLILGPWYADPSTWEAIGYPGPLKELS